MADQPTKLCQCCKQDLPHTQFYKRAANKDGLYSYCRSCNTMKAREFAARTPGWKEHKREYDRQRVSRLRDEISEYGRARYALNKEDIKERVKDWSAKNPEKRRAISQNYKHRRRAVERDGMTGSQLGAWKKAQAKVCYWCGDKCAKAFHVDHYIPLSKGGKHEASNLVIACRDCNYRKHAKDPLAFAREVGRLF